MNKTDIPDGPFHAFAVSPASLRALALANTFSLALHTFFLALISLLCLSFSVCLLAGLYVISSNLSWSVADVGKVEILAQGIHFRAEVWLAARISGSAVGSSAATAGFGSGFVVLFGGVNQSFVLILGEGLPPETLFLLK
jgi:hypothetical protein